MNFISGIDMKKLIIISFIIINSLCAQSNKLTLKQSLQLGLKNSKEIQIANSKIKRAKARMDEIGSTMFPKLSLSAGYTRLSDVPPFAIQLPFVPSGGDFTIQETILNNYNLGASIEQPIFTGFKLSALKSAANYNIKAEEVLWEKTKNDKSEEIQKSFWNYYNAQEMVELLYESLITLQSHLRDTKNFLDNGMVTKNDYLKIEFEVENTRLKLLDANNGLKIARSIFNKSIGLPLNSETYIIVEEINIESINEDYLSINNEAAENREEILSTNLRLKALEEKRTAAKSELYPQLFAFANYNYNKPNQRYLPLEDKFNDSWGVGVGLKWNIWNWGGTSAKVEQAEQDYFQLENTYKLLKENIELDVYNKYLTLESKIEKIKLSQLQVVSAEENYRITKEKFSQQLATSTELIDAETNLLKAKTTLITSKIEYRLSKIALEKSVGRKIY